MYFKYFYRYGPPSENGELELPWPSKNGKGGAILAAARIFREVSIPGFPERLSVEVRSSINFHWGHYEIPMQIKEGIALVEQALASRRFGPYTLQAAIAAVHAEASTAAATDWRQIVGLYDVLLRVEASPVVELNRAAAVAMRDGPEIPLALVDAILARGELAGYHLARSARADLCRRLGRTSEAIAAYERALALTTQAPERRFIERRLAELKL